jgi:LPS export ABC transporter protein LptC
MDMGRRVGSVTITLFSLLLFLSCSFAPEEMVNDRPAEFPDMRLETTRYLLGLDGMEPIRIEARLIEIYSDAKQAFITDAEFTQYNNSGVLQFAGSFGSAVVDTETKDVFMEQGVEIRNYPDEFTITAESLHWNNEEKQASADESILVTITMNEHDILSGTGFRGDFASATFEFDRIEEGTLTYE